MSESNVSGQNESEEDLIPLHKNREYVTWLWGSIFRDFGGGIARFAFPLITLAVTGDLGLTGTVAMWEAIGAVLGMIPGGVLADRFDRKKLMLWSSSIGLLTQIALITLLLSSSANWVTLAALACFDSFRASVLGFSSIILLKQIVPSRQLPRALAVNQGRSSAIGLVASPISGALLSLGRIVPPLANMVGYAGHLLSTFMLRGSYHPQDLGASNSAANLRARQGDRADQQSSKPRGLRRITIFQDISEALTWLWQQPMRRSLIFLAMFANLGANGVIVTVILWLGDSGIKPAIGGLMMHITPVQMQGRVNAAMSFLGMGLTPLAPAITGWGLKHLGPFATIAIFAGINGLSAIIALISRELRNLPAADKWDEYLSAEPPNTSLNLVGG